MLTKSAPAKIDRQTGVMRNCKLIGFESRNGRIYPPEVLRGAVHLYEGAKVNIDHPERGPMAERKISDRIGVIRNARFVEGRGVYGDFHYNPHHPMAERVVWDAENNPSAMGFSHNATMRTGKSKNGMEVVVEIIAIRSIDLVADPATTTSLFESFKLSDKMSPMSMAFRKLIAAIVSDESNDTRTMMRKIRIALETQQAINRDDEAEADAESEAEKNRILQEKLRKIRTGIESIQPRESLSQLAAHAELLQRTLEALERPARQIQTRWGVGDQAKAAREAELKRAASRLKR
jgi:hypothetical protein